MIIGIDASNIRAGGGITHLSELLYVAEPEKHGVEKVIVWGNKNLIKLLPEKSWLQCMHEPLLDKNYFFRIYWQIFKLSKLAKKYCDALFIPGGTYLGKFKPYVTICQNMLPFDFRETCRYFPRLRFFKFLLLRYLQTRTFKRANGLIVLSDYIKEPLNKFLKKSSTQITAIPHGINNIFFQDNKTQKNINEYNKEKPFRFSYISTVDYYKHQWHVINAVTKLRQSGFPVSLDIVGAAYPPALKKMQRNIKKIDDNEKFINYIGGVEYDQLPQYYANADAFIFASSCETFGNILLEAMSAGLPIACSNKSVMPEILQDAGIYFDPENPIDISQALVELVDNKELRKNVAQKAQEYAKKYSWQKCADQTFEFLAKV
jgi:glycosyltransferase involved in cell wall biosynthesis